MSSSKMCEQLPNSKTKQQQSSNNALNHHESTVNGSPPSSRSPANRLSPSNRSPTNRSPLNRSPTNRSPPNRSPTTRTSPKLTKSDHQTQPQQSDNDEVQSRTDTMTIGSQGNDLNDTHHNHHAHHRPTVTSVHSEHNPSDNEQHSEQPNKESGKQTEKDSPAFRLRARRSTPRKLDSIYSSPYHFTATTPTSRKFSLYSPNSSEQLQAKVAKLKSIDVKRNLFGASPPPVPVPTTTRRHQNHTSNRTEPHNHPIRRAHSPSRSLVDDVDLNVFAENILVEKLTEGKNNLNYLCLRIIEVLDEEAYLTDQPQLSVLSSTSKCSSNSDSFTNSCSSNNAQDCSPSGLSNRHPQAAGTKARLLKIYCQQAETKSALNVQKPVVLLYLFDEYVEFKNRFQAGKLIEIVKFEVKPLPRPPLAYRHSSSSLDVAVYPFYIELKADRTCDWVSLISVKVKKKFEPTNLSLLNVINTQNKYQTHENIEDQPPTKNPRVVFSSYVVKTEPIEHPNHNLQNTKSPTIKRFMKTINKNYAQDSTLKLKIKREKS